MFTKDIDYKEVKKGNYKYETLIDHAIGLGITLDQVINTQYITVSTDGIISTRQGYCWDGSSGPAFDTKNCMRASHWHDALYQLIRLRYLRKDKVKPLADKLYQCICIEDGMSRIRAWWRYQAVKWFGSWWAL